MAEQLTLAEEATLVSARVVLGNDGISVERFNLSLTSEFLRQSQETQRRLATAAMMDAMYTYREASDDRGRRHSVVADGPSASSGPENGFEHVLHDRMYVTESPTDSPQGS